MKGSFLQSLSIFCGGKFSFPVFAALSLSHCLQLGGQADDREALPGAQALLPVDEEGVALDLEVVLQPGLVDEQVLVSRFGLVQLPVEKVHGLLDLADLLHEPVMNGIAAELNIWPVGSGLQTGLSHL